MLAQVTRWIEIATRPPLPQECITPRFTKYDGGRAQSRRPRQTNDCTVRAIAIATGLPYDDVYDQLAAAGRVCGKGFNLRKWTKQGGLITCAGPRNQSLYWEFRWRPLHNQPGKPRLEKTTPGSFALTNPCGAYILHARRHVMACVDGVIVDSFKPRNDETVYGYWEVVKA